MILTKNLLTYRNKYKDTIRRNFLNVEDMYETRNIHREEVYIAAKIRTQRWKGHET